MNIHHECRKFEDKMPDLLLTQSAEAGLSTQLRAHLASCAGCAARLHDLRATMSLLDEWHAPEISPYFDSKLAARLRSEKAAEPAGFFERLQARLLFGASLQFKSAAAVAALVLLLGGGSYAGFTNFHHDRDSQSISATVNDLQILDHNDQVISQLDVLDDGTDGGDTSQN